MVNPTEFEYLRKGDMILCRDKTIEGTFRRDNLYPVFRVEGPPVNGLCGITSGNVAFVLRKEDYMLRVPEDKIPLWKKGDRVGYTLRGNSMRILDYGLDAKTGAYLYKGTGFTRRADPVQSLQRLEAEEKYVLLEEWEPDEVDRDNPHVSKATERYRATKEIQALWEKKLHLPEDCPEEKGCVHCVSRSYMKRKQILKKGLGAIPLTEAQRRADLDQELEIFGVLVNEYGDSYFKHEFAGLHQRIQKIMAKKIIPDEAQPQLSDEEREIHELGLNWTLLDTGETLPTLIERRDDGRVLMVIDGFSILFSEDTLGKLT